MRTNRRLQGVTTAPVSRREDRNNRMRTYLYAMSFRVAAFPLSVWALMSGQLVIGIILAMAAIFIPSVAVMTANNVDHRQASNGPVSPTRALPVTPSQNHYEEQ
ncbi:DUF3099 domain-containing protein [Ornithinimicrobium sp. INDO-MA30-4]|uniref:DUF3099 domain-containing protein n=1 Tax=Ornithinimicrobium sp. INDO-MA30-4 TaxID=2908651 RepID=UPI001F447B04|nr:DUF3099 domain-containing protein [Ornithinimicrobium sp. INDO-MA30-4]UJH71049.1 DUF3099 domain-containing protein [Ornithinimicrobium sp. INDO-MA30-4]